ncbi:MAG: right-handed parallel beta-helix repeat-containing protein [Myxococcota bacterium]|nr:right-handed parallel beta-helix repeat-containing protein [Deltaproteobacteria bacterium]MDQ3339678.1 right-handed parallel beta-helix repeat-containing protein [Myxococcota bacterium]
MRFLALVAIVGCNFSTKLSTPGDGDSAVDAMPDAPPPSALVKFTSITSTTTQLRPGLYGIELSATLRNELPNPITDLAVTLTFSDGTSNRAADFRWRDVDAREMVMTQQPQMIGSNQEAIYRFKIDALPWAVPPGPITINGAATFLDGTTPLSASSSATPLALPFATFGSIVVNSVTDELDLDTQICLREALVLAVAQGGLDRIVFDPTVFPPAAPVVTLLSDGLGEIGLSQDVVIDGRGAGVILAIDNSWENDNRYALEISNGNVVISGLTFKNFGYSYENEDLSTNNCGSNTMHDGGALRINNGQLILEGNTFEDPDVGERNCFAASIRLEGGTRHRILNNTWTNQSMDAIYVDSSTLEISGNVMNAGNNTAKTDECIFIATQGGAPLWITNNICVDQEYSAVIAGGTDAGALFVVNNTFVRNGLADLSAVRRSGNRAITLRNNVYVGNNPAAIALDNNGTGFNVAYESHTGSPLFTGSSSSATVANIISPGNPALVDSNGATRAALTPLSASPLVGSGVDFLDVNGRTPNHYNGSGPERGAVELP